jgi:hypothetical protein
MRWYATCSFQISNKKPESILLIGLGKELELYQVQARFSRIYDSDIARIMRPQADNQIGAMT